jgi:transcription elongation factor Elf1
MSITYHCLKCGTEVRERPSLVDIDIKYNTTSCDNCNDIKKDGIAPALEDAELVSKLKKKVAELEERIRKLEEDKNEQMTTKKTIFLKD